MDDLISRQAAIGAIEEYADRLQIVNWKENPGVPYKVSSLNWCINTIRDLPSIDAVPVVRCKDCKWSDWYTSFEGKVYCYCMETGAVARTEEDFCSRAEREQE